VSGVPGGHDVVADALSDIVAEAEAIRQAGRLPVDYEADLDRRFTTIAQDPAGLASAVEAGALSAPQAYRFRQGSDVGRDRAGAGAGGRSGLRRLTTGVRGRSVGRASGISRRGVAVARRVAGPRLRSLQRQTLDQAGRMAEAMATRGQVTSDRVRRVATSGGSSSRLDRLSPGGRALPAGAARTAGRSRSWRIGARDASGADAVVADWAIERIGRRPGGQVLHVECGEGALVARMAELGHTASGADPATEPSESILRAAALERLGRQARSSLDGLVLSGVTDDVSPASARALAHLAASRLRSDGVVVIVSSHPPAPGRDDPITADLARRRPLHPVTWCHLLARYGFGEITVFDPQSPDEAGAAEALYGVAGRRV